MSERSSVLSRVEHRLRRQLAPGPLVLCFHSVRTNGKPDDAIGSTTRAHFAEMMQVVRRVGRVVPLEHLVSGEGRTTARERRIALTFDDGYRDNLEVVMPILERYEFSATFFVTTSMLHQRREYAWDELEQIVTRARQLPEIITLESSGGRGSWTSPTPDQRGCNGVPSPQARRDLYISLLRFLIEQPQAVQQDMLSELADILNVRPDIRAECSTMTAEDVCALDMHPLASIGSHTASHPLLPRLSIPERVRELSESRRELERILGRAVDTLAYPYGGVDEHSPRIAEMCGYSTTFTIDPRAVRPAMGRQLLPRFMVRDGDAESLEQLLVWMFGT